MPLVNGSTSARMATTPVSSTVAVFAAVTTSALSATRAPMLASGASVRHRYLHAVVPTANSLVTLIDHVSTPPATTHSTRPKCAPFTCAPTAPSATEEATSASATTTASVLPTPLRPRRPTRTTRRTYPRGRNTATRARVRPLEWFFYLSRSRPSSPSR